MFYNTPFDHWIVDDFISTDLARTLSNDFIHYDNTGWYVYDNPLENKKTLNNWWFFPPDTYNFFEYLSSPSLLRWLEIRTGIKNLYPDPGLHGAGWHIHGNGGKLNVHLDYSLHPKLNLQRKLNLILYLSEDWDTKWGGNLEFWSGDKKRAHSKMKTIDYKFKRAVIFDTTQNSWHGFPDAITCPAGKYRKSIAVYYLADVDHTTVVKRKRALYSPSHSQLNDPEILNLIRRRASIK